MSNVPRLGIADLHLHLYGSIHHQDYLEHLTTRSVDWSTYEEAYEAAFQTRPNLDSVLSRHRLGLAGSEDDFRRLFVFGDRDAGSFQRFQAKYNMLVNGSSFTAYLNGVGSLAALITELRHFTNKIITRQQQQGVIYAEQRISLGRLSNDDCRQVARAILDAYHAYESGQFQPRLVVSLPRDRLAGNDCWPMS